MNGTRRHSPSHAPEQTQSHRWMVSYLDVLTILLLLFVTATAASLKKPATPANANQSKSASAALSNSPPSKNAGRQTGEDALQMIEQKLKEEGLDVRRLPSAFDGAFAKALAINLPQSVVFAPGDDRVRAAALPDLRKIAEVLRGCPNKVNLAGHADATPIHNRRFKNNWELAAARSLRLMETLTERYGLDPSRVSISSYGALEPKSPNDTPTGRASNRRVEILLYAQ